MRHILVVILAVGMALGFALSQATSSPMPLAAPTNLVQRIVTGDVPRGGWINGTWLVLQFRIAGTGQTLTPEIELRPVDDPLIGFPNYHGIPVSPRAGQTAIASLRIEGLHANTGYTWQARVVDDEQDSGTWATFGDSSSAVNPPTPAFSIDTTAPAAPKVTSPTNPRPGSWYRTKLERFSWSSSDTGSGIAGYSSRIDHQVRGKPGKVTTQRQVAVRNLADGKWLLQVWAQDRAGNWSKPTLYRFNLDTTPPKIRSLGSSIHDFNPYLTTQTWRFSTSDRAHVVVEIRRSGQKQPVLSRDLGTLSRGTHAYTWDGKTAGGQLSPADWHWFHVIAVDSLGNSSNLAFGGIHVRPQAPILKRIVISLSQQEIYAYEGDRLVWRSLATTGNQTLTSTPAGRYHIFARYSPYQFVSPWPPGHPYWYASAWSSYAMEFIQGGYFIHDAPWRSVFGPASQGGGTPGTDYGGTHGCVNAPYSTAQFLYGWAPLGTPVDVVW